MMRQESSNHAPSRVVSPIDTAMNFVFSHNENGPAKCYQHSASPNQNEHLGDARMATCEDTTTREIPIYHKGEVVAIALVDAEDFDWLNRWRWRVHGQYAGRTASQSGKQYGLAMHRLIMDAPKGMEVDHINGNHFDNRRCNLRICTRQENQWNRKPMIRTSSYKGVCFHKGIGKWVVQIRTKEGKKNMGVFTDEIEAAKAYDVAARKYHGEYARLNFPEALL